MEFSTLTTFPGAFDQDQHPDAGMEQLSDLRDWNRMISGFIYLVRKV